jgi:hypothetical protein
VRIGLLSGVLAALASVVATGCGSSGSTFDRSCAGEAVPNCRPYDYSRVSEGSLTPDDLQIGDVTATGTFHARVDTCASAPSTHEVVVKLLATRGGALDAGDSLMVFTVATLHDDGTMGDETAGDGVYDQAILGPLGSEIPPSSDVTLVFEPRAGLCVGDTLEVPYHTGTHFSPDAGL